MGWCRHASGHYLNCCWQYVIYAPCILSGLVVCCCHDDMPPVLVDGKVDSRTSFYFSSNLLNWSVFLLYVIIYVYVCMCVCVTIIGVFWILSNNAYIWLMGYSVFEPLPLMVVWLCECLQYKWVAPDWDDPCGCLDNRMGHLKRVPMIPLCIF